MCVFFLTGWVSTKSVDTGVQKTFQSISIFNHPIHLNFGLHSSGAVSHYHATKSSVICLQLLGLCLSSFFDNLQLVLIPLGVSWAYLPSPAGINYSTSFLQNARECPRGTPFTCSDRFKNASIRTSSEYWWVTIVSNDAYTFSTTFSTIIKTGQYIYI